MLISIITFILCFLLLKINYINTIIYLSSETSSASLRRLHFASFFHLLKISHLRTVIIICAAILNVTAIITNDIEILEINKAYPVIYAARLVRGTTITFLLAIL